MLTGKKYKYGSALWRIMLLAQMSMVQAVYANPGDGGVIDVPSSRSMALNPEMAMSAKTAMMKAEPDMNALRAAHQAKFKHVLAEIPAAAQAMQERRALPTKLPQTFRYNWNDMRVEQPGPHTLLLYALNEKAVIESDAFSVGKHDQVFVRGITKRAEEQKSSSGVLEKVIMRDINTIVLQKVTGTKESEISGLFDVQNGHMWLSNPNGIVLNGKIKGNFLASNLDIKAADFYQAKDVLKFKGEFEANESSIQSKVMLGRNLEFVGGPGKYLAVLATHVNGAEGPTLVAPASKVMFQNGEKVIVDLEADGFLHFMVDNAKATHNLSMQLAGVSVEAAYIFLGAQDVVNILENVVNVGGLKAIKVKEDPRTGIIHIEGGDNSKITLQGTLSATGEGTTGGTVHVLGDEIHRGSKSIIDVSGDLGGGEVIVGGVHPSRDEFKQGQAKPFRMARKTTVAKGAVTNASSKKKGNGGKVSVWGADALTDAGDIYAKGGAEGGDGGFVERSSFKDLNISMGTVTDVREGRGGNAGVHLRDPGSITVDDPTRIADLGAAPSGMVYYELFGDPGGSGILSPGTLLGDLLLGNLVLQTHNTVLGANPPSRQVGNDPAVAMLPTSPSIAVNDPTTIVVNNYGSTPAAGTTIDLSMVAGTKTLTLDASNGTDSGTITLGPTVLGNHNVYLKAGTYNIPTPPSTSQGTGALYTWQSGAYVLVYGPSAAPSTPSFPIVPGSNIPAAYQQYLADINRYLVPSFLPTFMPIPQFGPGPQFGPVPQFGPGPQFGPSPQFGPAPQGVPGSAPQGPMAPMGALGAGPVGFGPMGPIGPNTGGFMGPISMPNGAVSVGAPVMLTGFSPALASFGLVVAPPPGAGPMAPGGFGPVGPMPGGFGPVAPAPTGSTVGSTGTGNGSSISASSSSGSTSSTNQEQGKKKDQKLNSETSQSAGGSNGGTSSPLGIEGAPTATSPVKTPAV